MKPLMENVVGKTGYGTELILFKGKDAQGDRLLDPRKAGHLSVKYRGKIYNWRLPLGSLMPPRFDPETDERFPGNKLASSKDPD